MRTCSRYILLLLGVPLYFYLLLADFEGGEDERPEEVAETFWTDDGERNRLVRNYGELSCTMQSCFNFSRCLMEQPNVYVYPSIPGEFLSTTYSKILSAIRESAYYTTDPSEACLFVLSVDTVDRDKISENYVRDVNSLISTLPSEIWNGGLNHVIFNLYHGTFPDYADHNLGFNTGKAIIARASPSVQHFRSDFDISFPLFHKEHHIRSGPEKFLNLRADDRHLVSFKGKRYVYGIGSETRDALHHLHNGEAVAMITTCKHNNDWKEHQDERCEGDNAEYDKWDYEATMANSTFCLTPRGRRLGSFRFLESLRTGCIPVILSDDWVLPFEEVLDWTRAAVIIAEENVLLTPELLYEIPEEKVIRMKEHGRFLYNRYFRDVESITLTTLRIILERVHRKEGYVGRNWNIREKITLKKDATAALVVLGSNEDQGETWMKSERIEGIQEILVLWSSENDSPPPDTSYVKFLEKEKIVFIPKFSKAESFILLDERTPFDPNDIRSVMRYLNIYPDRLIGIHGIDFDPILQTVNFARLYNAVYPSIIGVNRINLERIEGVFPYTLLQECFATALNLFVSDTSMQAPVVIGTRPVLPHMQNSKNLDCWKKISSRWTNGLPLYYSDFHFV